MGSERILTGLLYKLSKKFNVDAILLRVAFVAICCVVPKLIIPYFIFGLLNYDKEQKEVLKSEIEKDKNKCDEVKKEQSSSVRENELMIIDDKISTIILPEKLDNTENVEKVSISITK